MTCKTCGEKPKKDKHFPSAVIEINNPESLVMWRKVIIPASMGDETDVPASVGKYRNVILRYEANKHTYIYSSDGIPTLLEMDVPQEVLDKIAKLETDLTLETSLRQDADAGLSDRIDTVAGNLSDEATARENADGVLQQEIDDLKNSPDVVDIVATYADLMAYDTSSLGDKDVIRVLADETHEGQSDYYRWSTTTETWTFIGTVGNYYTKDQIDNLLDEKQDELTPGENVSIVDESGALVISATDTTYDNFVGTDGTAAGTSGLVPAPTTTDAGKVLGANGSWVTGGPTVVQTTGSNSDVVMSQKAVTDMVYARNNSTGGVLADVRIGANASVTFSNLSGSTAIGDYATARGVQSVALGGSNGSSTSADARGSYSVAIGRGSSSAGEGAVALGAGAWTGDKSSISPAYSVALGANSTTSVQGEVSFGGTKLGTDGYNSTQYRLLTNIHDPQNAHDAATKGYVDDSIPATFATNEWNALWA